MRRPVAAAVVLAIAPLLDDFSSVTGWTAAPADGVRLELSEDGGALRLDFDYQGHAGWAAARKAFPLRLPENWAFRFRVRGETAPQTLEFKLLDPSGQKVWWSVRRDFAFPREWTTLTVRKRQVSFAWGPAGGGDLRELGAIEFAIVNASGGRGTVWIDDLSFEECPSSSGPLPVVRGWKGASETSELVLDLGGRREFSGLSLAWDAADFARRYEIEVSDDGRAWSRARSVTAGGPGRARILLPDSEAAFVRLRFLESARGRGYVLEEALIVAPEVWENTTKLLESVAKEEPRGRWPRSFVGEQIYWTLVGVDGGAEKGLLSEDGALEVGRGQFSLEPFLSVGGKLVGWAEAETSQSLAQGDLPIPSVRRKYAAGISLEATAFADGPRAASTLRARYRIRNSGAGVERATLYLALRPVQVNPPSQWLGKPGGFAPIRTMRRSGGSVQANGRTVLAWTAPSAFRAIAWESGEIVSRLASGGATDTTEASDPDGLASGALAWDLEIPAGASRDVVIAVPLSENAYEEKPANPAADFQSRMDAAARAWRESLGGATFTLPSAATEIAQTANSNLAWILINRDGPAIRPGSRSYARSWIRDGALTSTALLRLGHFAEVRDFLRWYVPYVYENGAVPCCVDSRGADPVPEHDSHGELLYLAGEYLAYTGDRATVEEAWPTLAKVVAHIDALRAQRRTEEYRTGEKRFFYGLLPESISHEGYSARPVHSYWDDFWAVRGLSSVADVARALGKDADAARITASRDELRADLHASIRAVIEARSLDYVPGSADLGDFDATSTTIALEPGEEQSRLPEPQLSNTFEKYWKRFEERRAHRRAPGNDYTPYEWRIAGSFVRLGRRDRAAALSEFFFADRRPAGWKHWAEVVWNEPREARFIGDMPHGWVGSDFLRSFLDLFAYERPDDSAVVVGAGLPPDWLHDPRGVAVSGLRTRYGRLDLRFRVEAGEIHARISGDARVPPGGFALPWPFAGRPSRASVGGKAAPVNARGEAVARSLPAEISLFGEGLR